MKALPNSAFHSKGVLGTSECTQTMIVRRCRYRKVQVIFRSRHQHGSYRIPSSRVHFLDKASRDLFICAKDLFVEANGGLEAQRHHAFLSSDFRPQVGDRTYGGRQVALRNLCKISKVWSFEFPPPQTKEQGYDQSGLPVIPLTCELTAPPISAASLFMKSK